MSAQKKKASYTEYLEFFVTEARDRGWNGTKFMEMCGLPKQRLSEFRSGAINFTASYFLKLCEGLRITEEYVEKKSGKGMTEEQRRGLAVHGAYGSYEHIVYKLITNKKFKKDVFALYEQDERAKKEGR